VEHSLTLTLFVSSLSQRLYLSLVSSHDISIEYAISDELMISSVALAKPDLIICPFLTTLIPKQIYSEFLTLIVHPGPPGDGGPSALDWVLMGDDGSFDNADDMLGHLDTDGCLPGRSHWGVTVLQAIEEFDAGPVWAFEQFPVDIDQPGLTKSELYRGSITRAALKATLMAVDRIHEAAIRSGHDFAGGPKSYGEHNCLSPVGVTCTPRLRADPAYAILSVSDQLPFQGGRLQRRPLLRAADREFDLSRHNAQTVSRRVRSGDSQPGVMSRVFGTSLYIYGGIVEEGLNKPLHDVLVVSTTHVMATRNGAVCVTSCDGKGIWITHVRRPKSKQDKALWPKVPATDGLIELCILTPAQVQHLHWPSTTDWILSPLRTYQEVWIDFHVDENLNKVAYLYFDFCTSLIE